MINHVRLVPGRACAWLADTPASVVHVWRRAKRAVAVAAGLVFCSTVSRAAPAAALRRPNSDAGANAAQQNGSLMCVNLLQLSARTCVHFGKHKRWHGSGVADFWGGTVSDMCVCVSTPQYGHCFEHRRAQGDLL